MKNIILMILGVMIGLYTVGICFSVFSIEIRQNALEEHVSRVVFRTLEEEYRAMDVERVYENLKEELALNVGKNGRVEVEIGKLDLEKGIIHVVVKEYFRQFNGKEKVLTCEKTAIMDSEVPISYNAGAIGAITDTVTTKTISATMEVSQGSSASGVYTNAQQYYDTYAGKMIFKPIDDTEAGVFYGTKAKLSSTAYISYETIGWCVTIKDNAGTVMDQVYYALDGENIRIADERTVDGYIYKLYNITLNTLKNRLSDAAQEALKRADCSIVFDACLVVKTNGVRGGGMTDAGISWGTVYTTYDGIVSAAGWTDKTRETLKSYFNKEIPDMFFTVNLEGGTGIAGVIGSGRYCYGTEITIDAVPQTGYRFLEWVGPFVTSTKNHTFTVYEDVTLKATTVRDSVAVNLYRNLDAQDTCVETVFFEFGSSTKKLQPRGWTKEGYYQTGWSTSRIVQQPYYALEQEFTDAWLERVAPSEELYATWSPNEYTIVFCANGASGAEIQVSRNYVELLTMPAEEFAFSDGSIAGWSLSANAEGAEFQCGENVAVVDLAKRSGVENVNGATIYLYAQKDCAPRIFGASIYVPLTEAMDGKITESKLLRYVFAMDKEDGRIPYGDRNDGAFLMLDFAPERYRECRRDCCIVERLYARDSAGNEVYQDLEVYVIEDVKTAIAVKQKVVRFISDKYYKDERGNFVSEEDGGLAENSVWRWNPTYSAILDEIFP